MEPLVGLLGFTRALRAAGLSVGGQRASAFTEAISQLDIADPRHLYWAGRATLCGEPDDIPVYERVFTGWFGEPPRTSSLPKPASRHAAPHAALSSTGNAQESAEQLPVAASADELLRQRDVSELSDTDRARLRAMLATLKVRAPLRTGHRQRPDRAGTLDPRRTLRTMLATGGEPIRLRYQRKTPRPRRVVLLVDVSGSMNPYADTLLRFAHVVTQRIPTETFTIGTRLTRITRALRHRDAELAQLAAARAVPDWAGGTRIGETLRVFSDRWGQRGLARGAIVVVFSDGWERGDTGLLAEQMHRLKRLAHKVFWVNPHAGKDGYLPIQSGIAAVLPFVDALLAGHSLRTLEDLLLEVRDA